MSTLQTSTKPVGATGTPMLDRLLSLKPIYRWAIFLILAVAVWIVAQDYTWKAAADLDSESNRLARIIDDAATRNSMIEGSESVRTAVLAFGEARVPREERDGTEALQKSVDRAVKDAKIIYSLDVRSAGKFPSGAFPGIAKPGERVEKMIGDMKFEASQSVAIKVLEKLEASPDIESVSRIKLAKKSDSKLSVQLTVEAWVRVPDTRNR